MEVKSESEKLAKWNSLQHFVKSSKYLSSPADILNLALSSKAMTKRLIPVLLKKHLNKDALGHDVRINAWKSALSISLLETRYEDIISANLSLSKHIEDIIRMDVVRSFTQNKAFPSEDLYSIIKTGSLVLDPSIGYCQGMNYVAGLFLINYPPEIAFAMYVQFIESKMRPIFVQNFETLKRYFYVMDNLIDIFIPDLGSVFKAQKVQAVYYASPWMITAFTCALQYSEKSELVYKIIDLFMVQGYRAIFKAALAILSHFKEKMLKMSFENLMEFIPELTQKEIFVGSAYKVYKEKRDKGASAQSLAGLSSFSSDHEFVYSFKARCKAIKLKSEFIKRIEKRYQSIKNKIDF